MKKTTNYIFLLLIIVTIGIASSCKKDEETKPKTKEELLVGKKWQMKAATIDPSLPIDGGGTTTNLYNQLLPCIKDDFNQFNADGKVLEDAGGVKCTVDEPQTIQGNWLFNADKTIVTISYGAGDNESWKVLSLSESELKVEYQTDINGVVYTVTATFNKI